MTARSGREALFSGPPHGGNGHRPVAAGGEGRRALFSAPPRRRGSVVVECERCDARTPVPLVELGRYLVPSLWLPVRRYSRWMRCPSCRHLTWTRIRWSTVLG